MTLNKILTNKEKTCITFTTHIEFIRAGKNYETGIYETDIKPLHLSLYDCPVY